MYYKICPEDDELCIAYVVWSKTEEKYRGHCSMIKMKTHTIPKTRDSKNLFFRFVLLHDCYDMHFAHQFLSELGNGISASLLHKHHVILFLTALVCV